MCYQMPARGHGRLGFSCIVTKGWLYELPAQAESIRPFASPRNLKASGKLIKEGNALEANAVHRVENAKGVDCRRSLHGTAWRRCAPPNTVTEKMNRLR